MEIQERVALAPLTTFGIGGPARFFAQVGNTAELFEALAFAKEKKVPIFVLGGGSNVLIDDVGFDGMVIKMELAGIETVREDKTMLLVAAAGENWDTIVEKTVQENLWGIENLSGIPGSVGGAVVQNIGAYGAALSETFEWAEVFDTVQQKTKTLTKEVCAFGYRDSIFKQETGRYMVLHAAFRLSTVAHPNLSYKDMAERFGGQPGLREMREAVLEIRKNKFPDLALEGTAGSFFKNPVLSQKEAEKLQSIYPEMPLFPIPESNDIKIPLGWFLDYRHGVMDVRTIKRGGARMYGKQFLVLVVARGTSSKDVKELADEITTQVEEKIGLKIEPEVKII